MSENEKNKSIYKDEVVREVLAKIKIKDIKEYYNLKDKISIKWWESVVSLLLFISMLGFMVTAIYIILQETSETKYMLTWLIALNITIIWGVEFLIYKIYAISKLFQIQMKLITDIQKEVDKLKESNIETKNTKQKTDKI